MIARVVSAIRGNRIATDDRGVVLVYVALSLTVIMALVAVVFDYGNLALGYRMTQNAAEAAAFAAAEVTRTDLTGTITPATIAAKVNPIMARYGYTGGELTLTYLDSSNNSVTPGAATRIRAQIDHTLTTNFVHSLVAGGGSNAPVRARSAARVGSGPVDAFYLMGSTGQKELFVNGSGSSLTVINGGIYVNSSDPSAFQVVSGGVVTTGTDNVISALGTEACGGCSPSPVQVVTPIPDPFASIQAPILPGTRTYFNDPTHTLGDHALSTGTLTINSGYYNSISVTGGHLIMNPGTYVLSSGFSITSGTVTGAGVMLYFTCGGPSLPAACNKNFSGTNSGQSGAVLNLGGGTYTLSAPTSGAYQGLLIFYDRWNKSTMSLTTNSADSLSGSIYGIFPHTYPDTMLTLTGNSSATLLNSTFVVSNIKVTGNSTLIVNYGSDSQYRKGGESNGTAW